LSAKDCRSSLFNACDRFHCIDVLINNAGFVARTPLCASI
jgi:short-subunit dehydrogenase